jgi:hypothetical protein
MDFAAFPETAPGGLTMRFGFRYRALSGSLRPFAEAGFGVIGYGDAAGVGPVFGAGLRLVPEGGPGLFVEGLVGHGAFIESAGNVLLLRAGIAVR